MYLTEKLPLADSEPSFVLAKGYSSQSSWSSWGRTVGQAADADGVAPVGCDGAAWRLVRILQSRDGSFDFTVQDFLNLATRTVWKNVKHDRVGRAAVDGIHQMKKLILSALRSLQKTPALVQSFFNDPSLAYIADAHR